MFDKTIELTGEDEDLYCYELDLFPDDNCVFFELYQKTKTV